MNPRVPMTTSAALYLAAALTIPVALRAQGPDRATPPRPAAQEAPDAQPAGATARCRDGTFTTSEPASACAARGGVLVSFPVAPVPPRPRPAAATSVTSVPEDPASVPAGPAAPPPPSPGAVEEPQPADASGRCRDGSYVVAAEPDAACGGRGGILARFPRPATLPVSAARVRPADASTVPTMLQRPANATAQCRDGSFAVGLPTSSMCASNGGVAAIFPPPRSVPTPPATP